MPPQKENPMTRALKTMQSRWDVNKEGGGTNNVPKGRYDFRLQLFKLDQTSSGDPCVKRESCVLEGEYMGEVIYDQINLNNDFGMRELANFIMGSGYAVPDNAEDIPETIEAINADAPCFTADVVINGDFTNVRAREFFAAEETGEEQAEEQVEEQVEEPVEEQFEEEAGELDEVTEGLRQFAVSMSLVAEEETPGYDELMNLLSGYSWSHDSVMPEEADLLVSVGLLEEKAEEPAPPPPPPRRPAPAKKAAAPAKAPAKKAPAPAPAKKPAAKPAGAAPARKLPGKPGMRSR